jgi:hypothetical protein
MVLSPLDFRRQDQCAEGHSKDCLGWQHNALLSGKTKYERLGNGQA